MAKNWRKIHIYKLEQKKYSFLLRMNEDFKFYYNKLLHVDTYIEKHKKILLSGTVKGLDIKQEEYSLLQ